MPVSMVISNLINMGFGFLLLLVFAVPFRQALGWPLLMLPVLVVLQAAFTTGIALALSALDVYFRDLNHLVGVLMLVWFFGTPVLYPLSLFGGKRLYGFLLLNPMSWLMDSYQRVWHANTWPDWHYLLAFATAAAVSLVLGAQIFNVLSRRFAEEV
jgi:ABC-2 type transport system permease protein